MIQDPSKDPYDALRQQAANAPKKGDIVSGLFPNQKAGEGPRLVDAHCSTLETPSGKERRELRQQQKQMKGAQFKFHIETFSQYCEDDQVRMMWRIINENTANGRKTVLMEFGYATQQLQGFIDGIKSHEVEIEEAKRKEGSAEGAPVPPPGPTPGDAV